MRMIQTPEELSERKQKDAMLLLYVSGRSCGVCRALEGKLDALLEAYPGISAAKIEADDAPELAAACGIFSVPALILFIEGKETMREAGIVSLDRVEQKIARYYALFMD